MMFAPVSAVPFRHATATKERIRVSFVIDSLSRAGTETQLLALIRLLDRERFEPTLILLDGTSPDSQALEPDCPVLRLGLTKLASRKALTAARDVKRFWAARPHIVQTYFLDSAYFAVPLAKLLGVKRVLRVRNNLGYWLTRKHRALDRMIRPFVSAMLTNCDTGREALERDGSRNVIVLENGVDLPVLKSPAPTGPVIGCVANLRPVKNIDGLLRAAAIVHRTRPDVTFAIAGDGPERASLEALRDSLGLQSAVRFHGSVSDVPAFLSTVSFAVLPSHSEGMSNALLEAMASAKPVVATHVGANARVLGETGLIVPSKDDAALAEGMLGLLNRDCAALGRLARRHVEEHYSRESMVRRFEAYYEQLIR